MLQLNLGKDSGGHKADVFVTTGRVFLPTYLDVKFEVNWPGLTQFTNWLAVLS